MKLPTSDRSRALDYARNPAKSKFGEILLKSADEQKDLSTKQDTIERNFQRNQRRNDAVKNLFLFQRETSKIDPIVILERGPSLRTWIRHQLGDHVVIDYDVMNDVKPEPGYMKPIERMKKSVSLLPTLDAYSVQRRKKKNLWEYPEEEKFKSLVPTLPLNKKEIDVLQRSNTFHQEMAEIGLEKAKANLKPCQHLSHVVKGSMMRMSPIDYVHKPAHIEQPWEEMYLSDTGLQVNRFIRHHQNHQKNLAKKSKSRKIRRTLSRLPTIFLTSSDDVTNQL